MTKSLLLKLCALGALITGGLECRAASFTYTDMISYIGQPLMNGSNPTRSGTFNILPGGSGNNVITVTTATGGSGTKYSDAGITYHDKDGFQIGKEKVTDPTYVSFYFRDNNDPVRETYSILLEDGYFSPGTVVSKSIKFEQIGGNVDIFAAIDSDGKFGFTVSRVTGDFYFDYARLDVTTTPVPEGGATAILLGFGAAGLALARRKLAAE